MTDSAAFTQNELGTQISIDDVFEAFEFLGDWEERYAYIIDLGRKLPAFPDDQKTDTNYVHGCQSQVWVTDFLDPSSGKLYLLIDSDAMIVRGLAAIIMIALNARTPNDLLTVDVDALFQKLDLFRHISPTRGNGLRAMVSKIRDIAAHAV
ncbi:SufE family protein [Mangrovitalea sediminis]|uniref:SufE family protein n=1 Tax=Mangrovitalea sediminis TaxID=1982043 RepID=UPI000BE5B8A3|nr:SufE family protein [Mangrovitalea sediminis]